MIKAVLFDFGGVIADEGFRDGLRAIAIQQGLDPDMLHRAGIDDVVNQLSILPEEAVFIDDAPDNIDRARSRGLHALLYVNRKRLEEELAKILKHEKSELSFL